MTRPEENRLWFRQVLLLRMHFVVRFHVSCQHGSESAKGESGRLQGFKYSFHRRFRSTF